VGLPLSRTRLYGPVRDGAPPHSVHDFRSHRLLLLLVDLGSERPREARRKRLVSGQSQARSQEKTEDNQQNKKKSNQQNNTNSKQQSSSTLPKDGEAVYKLEDNGSTTTLKYYFKDDIVYLQDAVYAFKPKEMGKTEEEIQKLLKKRHSIYDGVKGIESTIARKDGIYYHTLKIDYNNIDWKELHKRAPKTFTDENPTALKYSEAVPKLLEDGYVKQ